MARCKHCGTHVSADFARVFGDEQREVHACQQCSPNAGIADVVRERSPDA